MIDALWGAGYYNASVTIAIDGATLPIGSSDIAAFARAAETYRNRAAAPVVIKVDPGPLFKLRTARVVDALGVEFPEAELPQRIVGLKPGDPAAASEIRASGPASSTISVSKAGRWPRSSRFRRSSITRKTSWI